MVALLPLETGEVHVGAHLFASLEAAPVPAVHDRVKRDGPEEEPEGDERECEPETERLIHGSRISEGHLVGNP